MAEQKTISVASDPDFINELSEYLEILADPLMLEILTFIGSEPKEVTVIADHIGLSSQNTKIHLDRLVSTGLVQRGAGFGQKTEQVIAPVWNYSLAGGGLGNLTATLGVFSSIAALAGHNDIHERIRAVRSGLSKNGSPAGPVLYLIGGPAEGRAFILTKNRVPMGREDRDHPAAGTEGMVVLPATFRAVTRVTRPHAFLVRTIYSWQIEDNGSTGGTFLNSVRLDPLKSSPLSSGDVIDLSTGAHAARFLFIADE